MLEEIIKRLSRRPERRSIFSSRKTSQPNNRIVKPSPLRQLKPSRKSRKASRNLRRIKYKLETEPDLSEFTRPANQVDAVSPVYHRPGAIEPEQHVKARHTVLYIPRASIPIQSVFTKCLDSLLPIDANDPEMSAGYETRCINLSDLLHDSNILVSNLHWCLDQSTQVTSRKDALELWKSQVNDLWSIWKELPKSSPTYQILYDQWAHLLDIWSLRLLHSIDSIPKMVEHEILFLFRKMIRLETKTCLTSNQSLHWLSRWMVVLAVLDFKTYYLSMLQNPDPSLLVDINFFLNQTWFSWISQAYHLRDAGTIACDLWNLVNTQLASPVSEAFSLRESIRGLLPDYISTADFEIFYMDFHWYLCSRLNSLQEKLYPDEVEYVSFGNWPLIEQLLRWSAVSIDHISGSAFVLGDSPERKLQNWLVAEIRHCVHFTTRWEPNAMVLQHFWDFFKKRRLANFESIKAPTIMDFKISSIHSIDDAACFDEFLILLEKSCPQRENLPRNKKLIRFFSSIFISLPVRATYGSSEDDSFPLSSLRNWCKLLLCSCKWSEMDASMVLSRLISLLDLGTLNIPARKIICESIIELIGILSDIRQEVGAACSAYDNMVSQCVSLFVKYESLYSEKVHEIFDRDLNQDDSFRKSAQIELENLLVFAFEKLAEGFVTLKHSSLWPRGILSCFGTGKLALLGQSYLDGTHEISMPGVLTILDHMSPIPTTIRCSAIKACKSFAELIMAFYERLSSNSGDHQHTSTPQQQSNSNVDIVPFFSLVGNHSLPAINDTFSEISGNESRFITVLSELTDAIINIVQARFRLGSHLADHRKVGHLDRKAYQISNDTLYKTLECLPLFLTLSVRCSLRTWDQCIDLFGPDSQYAKAEKRLSRVIPMYIINGLLSISDFPYHIYEEKLINQWVISMLDFVESIQKDLTRSLSKKELGLDFFRKDIPINLPFDQRVHYFEGEPIPINNYNRVYITLMSSFSAAYPTKLHVALGK